MAERGMITLNKEFGPEHPEVVKTRAQVDDLRLKVIARVDGFLLGFQARVDSSRKRLENLNQEIETASTNDAARIEKMRPYFDAKRNLEQLLQFRQVLTTKIASEKIHRRLQRPDGVQII